MLDTLFLLALRPNLAAARRSSLAARLAHTLREAWSASRVFVWSGAGLANLARTAERAGRSIRELTASAAWWRGAMLGEIAWRPFFTRILAVSLLLPAISDIGYWLGAGPGTGGKAAGFYFLDAGCVLAAFALWGIAAQPAANLWTASRLRVLRDFVEDCISHL